MLDDTLPNIVMNSATREILAGLRAPRKTLAPKFFYDAAGVKLFNEITRLPEYYLTRAELALLRAHAPALASLCPPRGALVEWGASDEAKAAHLFAGGPHIGAYVPIDIAAPALAALARRLEITQPKLAVHPVVADFFDPLELPWRLRDTPRLGFFPGSTIGNFTPAEAVRFLAAARATLGPDAPLIVGADMAKDSSTLLAAYNDAQGITAAFNLNILNHVNYLTGGDFEPANFSHEAIWNATESRIEMHLRSRIAQTVNLAGHTIMFAKYETIHTENSHKFTQAALTNIALAAGFSLAEQWFAPENAYTLTVLRPRA